MHLQRKNLLESQCLRDSLSHLLQALKTKTKPTTFPEKKKKNQKYFGYFKIAWNVWNKSTLAQ